MPVWRQILLLTLILLVTTALLGECQQFEVLKISNVSFPTSDSSKWAAHARSTYQRNISEFTVCYRHLIESYNDGLYCPVNIGPWKFAQRTFSPGGGGVDGFTGSIISLWRNVHGGGLGNRSMPIGLWPLLPTDIDISKWYHICLSYSSILHHVHVYMDTFKVFSYTFEDPKEDPLLSNDFEKISLGSNMRGLITDLQVYDFFLPDKELAAQTQGCDNQEGQIFSWDPAKINITQVNDSFYTFRVLCYIPKNKISAKVRKCAQSELKIYQKTTDDNNRFHTTERPVPANLCLCLLCHNYLYN